VLDLRNTAGGLLNSSVGASAAFLPAGALITSTSGRTADSRMRLTASPENYIRGKNAVDPFTNLPPSIKTVPMVVLVNNQTASGAEIMAAALQDHKRAKIFGTRTFGMGTIYTILPLGNNTAIKLTTARFFRPSGGAITDLGVTPDTPLAEIKLTATAFGTAEDLQLIEAVKQLGGQAQLGK
jgi:carboxyl-terminal processing protease